MAPNQPEHRHRIDLCPHDCGVLRQSLECEEVSVHEPGDIRMFDNVAPFRHNGLMIYL